MASAAGGGGGGSTDTRKCEFCGLGPHLADPTDPLLGPWYLSGSGAAANTALWTHRSCTVWAAEVYEEDGVLQKVGAAIERSRSLVCLAVVSLCFSLNGGFVLQTCVKCRKRGAAIGCHVRSCRRSYHFRCAELSSAQFRPGDMHVYCFEHHTDESSDSKAGGSGAGASARKVTKRKSMGDDLNPTLDFDPVCSFLELVLFHARSLLGLSVIFLKLPARWRRTTADDTIRSRSVYQTH